LTEGFFVDRQQNKLNREVVTYYYNYEIMKGFGAVINKEGESISLA
jgi:hypothetical protein